MKPNFIPKPIDRSPLRTALGVTYFRLRRRLQWMTGGQRFAVKRQAEPLPYRIASHRTPLLRQLKDVDMWLQHNKVTNLRIASARVDGVILKPGETFSYWKLIGKPTRRDGYVDGMILHKGTVRTGVGGGLCQLSNLIYWLTLHTPLTVTERYRHGYDVFPDAGRTQPFGSGATCFYNYLDLQIRNDTEEDYQLRVYTSETDLIGEWRAVRPARYRYEVVETKHWITQELWGGYVRHNTLSRRRYDAEGRYQEEEFVAENHAIMMYEPCLPQG
ncbi:VanW family protein [Paenibacillus sp. GD4]|uniref:VanW family protein n=1 Tax=Paenibacillus sp. GD4 TaxID=3068890 RepID=UPI0027966039|nr:VanW family protein [Paenibacillus sp. GD4]MDQ1912207.1 VanW family protein [Paenibacillus sp. GD4]